MIMRHTLVLCLGLALAAPGVLGGLFGPDDIKCTTDAYPPADNMKVPTFVVNLDLPADQRWNEVLTAKKDDILKLRDALVKLIGGFMNGKILALIDELIPKLAATLPSPYKEELAAISNATGMPLGEVVLYNVFYEFFTVCTSIVAQNDKGEILHGRNLDFGLFLGWDAVKHTWSMTEVLRPNVIRLDWQKGGKTIFKSVNFAGYIGLLTTVNPGVMSLTINERFNLNGGFIGILQWILGDHDLQWVGFLSREIFEKQMTFEQATKAITEAKLLAPVYFIVGGTKPGQGMILTKDRNSAAADAYTMEKNGVQYADWYVLETNYDHWAAPPFFDDRRTSGHKCMLNMTQARTTFKGLFNVLSTQPNLNKLTAYTALMNVNTGEVETYLQDCEGDCSPW